MTAQIVDFTKTVKSSYNLKGKDMVSIVTGGDGDFIDGIKNVTALGSTLTVTVNLANNRTKTVKFTNVDPDMNIQALRTLESDPYWGGVNTTIQNFYDVEKFVKQRTWLSKPSATKVTGTVFDETIDVSEAYKPTVKNSRKGIGVTINAGGGTDKVTATYYNDKISTGAGDDIVDSGNGNDTIIIDGDGTKTIKVSKDAGCDTIIFKGNGVKAEVILDCDFDTSPFSGDYFLKKVGNNLCFTKLEESSDVAFLTIKDYFKYNNLNISAKDNGDPEELTAILKNALITVNGNAFKASTIVGTKYSDAINGGYKVDKITTGDGDDEIWALQGNDKITINGEGKKDIRIGRADGNDTILFDLDKVTVTDKIKVNLILYENPEISYTTKNQDLIITNNYAASATSKAVKQILTIKNYYGNTNKIQLLINDETDVYAQLLAANKDEATETKGTIFDDELSGTEGADTIKALAGNDTIYASKGNDKINGGDGDDVYVYDNFTSAWDDGKYYTDTIYNSGGIDTIRFTGLVDYSPYFDTSTNLYNAPYPSFLSRYGCSYIKKGNDLIINAELDNDVRSERIPMNKIVLKDYFKSAKGEYGVKYIDNGAEGEDYRSLLLEDDMVIEHSWRTTTALSDHKSNKYTGTDYNDYIEGSYKQDTLKGGDGNDYIDGVTSVSGKDYLYGGAGNDTLCDDNAYMYGGSGNDTYVSYNQDGSGDYYNVISDESGNDTLSLVYGSYLTYFDVTQKDGKVVSTGDVYVNDSTLNREYVEYKYQNTETHETFWSKDPDLKGENIKPYIETTAGWDGTPTENKQPTRTISSITEVGNDNIKYIQQNRVIYAYKYKDRNEIFYDADPNYIANSGRTDIVQYIDEFNQWDCETTGAIYTPIENDGKTYILEYMVYYGYTDSNGNKFFSTDYNLRGDEYTQLIGDNGEWVTYRNIDFTRIVEKKDHVDKVTFNKFKDDKDNIIYSTESSVEGYELCQTKNSRGNLVAETQEVETYYNDNITEKKGLINILKSGNANITIKNGTTTENAIENFTIGFNQGSLTRNGYAASYKQENIDKTAELVAAKLQEYGYGSMKDAIKNGTDDQLATLIGIYKNNMFDWSTVYSGGAIDNYADEISDYMSSDMYETYKGTIYAEDGVNGNGGFINSIYNFSLGHDEKVSRYSIINDYGGNDILNLDYNENGYSFLFDVEVDDKGNLLNYSRDFYVKFKGEETKETGVVINCGRDKNHAIESIYMKHDTSESNKHDLIFTYNQETIDTVRQNVAAWLTDNGYGSVQDVLHTEDADIEGLMAAFSEINNYGQEL